MANDVQARQILVPLNGSRRKPYFPAHGFTGMELGVVGSEANPGDRSLLERSNPSALTMAPTPAEKPNLRLPMLSRAESPRSQRCYRRSAIDRKFVTDTPTGLVRRRRRCAVGVDAPSGTL